MWPRRVQLCHGDPTRRVCGRAAPPRAAAGCTQGACVVPVTSVRVPVVGQHQGVVPLNLALPQAQGGSVLASVPTLVDSLLARALGVAARLVTAAAPVQATGLLAHHHGCVLCASPCGQVCPQAAPGSPCCEGGWSHNSFTVCDRRLCRRWRLCTAAHAQWPCFPPRTTSATPWL